jgi:hypothetical protein
MPSYRVRTQRIEVVAPRSRRVPGEAFLYSGTGTVTAPVVYVGNGRPIDYAGVDARDKIVMVDNATGFHRTAQLREVVQHGGDAMLYVSAAPDNLVQTGAVAWAQDFPAPIPRSPHGWHRPPRPDTPGQLRIHRRLGRVLRHVVLMRTRPAKTDAISHRIRPLTTAGPSRSRARQSTLAGRGPGAS